ncbi:MAG: hypothetical protein FJ087_07030 [Deltaproteobacteria bacterium]|nr:hypothetical protein [Deltaproteobacteria bacterium]
MTEPPCYRVDLKTPAVLDRVLAEHLRFGACPVDGQSFPGLLAPVTVVLELPDGSVRACDGLAALGLGPDRFIVQLAHKLDMGSLAFLASLAERVGHARGVARPHPAGDNPFDGAAVTPRRSRNLPSADKGGVAIAQERSVQPPPKVGRTRPLRPRSR